MNKYNKVENLQRRDLELNKKLDEITNATVKKLMTKAAPLPIVPINMNNKATVARNTPQAIADINARDLAFQVKLDDMTDQSLAIQPFKVERAITQEMIDDYTAVPLVPINIDGKSYKYNPSSLELNLDEVVLPFPNSVFNERAALEKVAAYTENLVNQKIPELKKKFLITRLSKIKIIREFNAMNPAERVANRNRFNLEVEHIDKILEALNKQLRNEENNYAGLPEVEDDAMTQLEANQQEIRRVNEANKEKIIQFEQDLKALNPNLNISQNIGESDFDYADRLRMVSNTEVSEEELSEAVERKNYLEAKKNVGKLIKSGPQAEVIVKYLSPEERFNFNKLASVIIKDFLEIYGFDNKRLSDREIIDFIRQSVNDPKALLTVKKLGPPPDLEPNLNEAPRAPASSRLTGPAFERLLGLVSRNRLVKGRNITENLNILRDNGILVPEDILNTLRTRADRDTAIQNNRDITEGRQRAAAVNDDETVGVGIKHYPKLVKFGKIYISGDDLYYKNILKIRNINQKAIIGFVNKKISDSLASVLLKIIDGEKITKSNLNLLSSSERHIYDKLMLLSGLHKTYENTFDKTAQDLKQRIETIRGEIEAGNNNPELLREGHTVLWNMAAIGMITGMAAKKHYNELKSYF